MEEVRTTYAFYVRDYEFDERFIKIYDREVEISPAFAIFDYITLCHCVEEASMKMRDGGRFFISIELVFGIGDADINFEISKCDLKYQQNYSFSVEEVETLKKALIDRYFDKEPPEGSS